VSLTALDSIGRLALVVSVEETLPLLSRRRFNAAFMKTVSENFPLFIEGGQAKVYFRF
jgi:hypothetical protein